MQIKEEVDKLLRLKAEAETAAESLHSPSGLPTRPDGQTDYTEDFFGKEAFLSVSGQLNAEAYACALSDVYTFGWSRSCTTTSVCTLTLSGLDVTEMIGISYLEAWAIQTQSS